MTDWAMGKLWEMRYQNNYNSLQNSGLCYHGSILPIGTNPLFPLILRRKQSDNPLNYNSLLDSANILHFENGGFCYGKAMGKAIFGSFLLEWPFFYLKLEKERLCLY